MDSFLIQSNLGKREWDGMIKFRSIKQTSFQSWKHLQVKAQVCSPCLSPLSFSIIILHHRYPKRVFVKNNSLAYYTSSLLRNAMYIPSLQSYNGLRDRLQWQWHFDDIKFLFNPVVKAPQLSHLLSCPMTPLLINKWYFSFSKGEKRSNTHENYEYGNKIKGPKHKN